MRLFRWHYLILAAALAIAIALVGCSGQTGTGQKSTGSTTTTTAETTDLKLDVVDQWTRSAHASAVAFAAEEDFCAGCHDGGAFAEKITNPKELGRDWVVATDCRACHTGQGPELARSGTASIPTEPQVKAGLGALCMGCHHGLGAPDPTDAERSAPHHSVQADLLTGTGAMPIEGVTFVVNQKHAGLKNACVTCHMKASSTKGAPPDHTFKPDFSACGAKGCHSGDMTDGGTAKGDYDGDGTKEKFTEEVQGLKDMLKQAIITKAGGGANDVKYDRGNVSFGVAGVKVDDNTYRAAYNLILIDNDLSNGIHNPQYAISMLRESYRLVTGQDAPGDGVK